MAVADNIGGVLAGLNDWWEGRRGPTRVNDPGPGMADGFGVLGVLALKLPANFGIQTEPRPR